MNKNAAAAYSGGAYMYMPSLVSISTYIDAPVHIYIYICHYMMPVWVVQPMAQNVGAEAVGNNKKWGGGRKHMKIKIMQTNSF